MAKQKSDKDPPEVAEDERNEAEDDSASAPELDREGELALAKRDGEGEQVSAEGGTAALARRDAEEVAKEEEGEAPAQLGTERYVLAGFFAFGMLAAYVFGRFVNGVWTYLSNKDWFSQTLPRVAAVGDDDKLTIGLVLGGLAALILVFRLYRKPDVRTWTDEVANELAKVKWPTKKEVSNSTIVVIATSAVATIYLALLDRLWGFITNLIYGDGS